MVDPRESNSPILFAEISASYLRAFEMLWKTEFEDRHSFHWDKSLIFHPISHLLGISLETALKGLLVCRAKKPPRNHNLENLILLLDDRVLENAFALELNDLLVPQDLLDMNSDKSLTAMQEMYRRHHIHISLLNRLYDQPFATRYPVLGGHSLPDPIAIKAITKVALAALDQEKRSWGLKQ